MKSLSLYTGSFLCSALFCFVLQANALNYGTQQISDTAKWHPERICIMRPEVKMICKLPLPKDQDPSGVANLFFQCKKTGTIHLIDSIDKYNNRIYNTRLTSEKEYDAILLYNNGKYIRYSNVVFKPDKIVEMHMENLKVHPSDSESQHWLRLRSFNNPAWIHGVHPNYLSDFPFYLVPGTDKWHPEAIYVVYPDMKMVFKLPDVKDQDDSGVFNLLFQCKETGKVHLLDTIKLTGRYINFQLTSGIYDVILLYNSGKYIKYDDITFEKGSDTEVNMKNLRIQPPDSISLRWLTLRAFNTAVDDRLLWKTYGTVSENRIRGYVFEEHGYTFEVPFISTESKKTGITLDGYFEMDVDGDKEVILKFTFFNVIKETSITANSGLLFVFEVTRDTNVVSSSSFRRNKQ